MKVRWPAIGAAILGLALGCENTEVLIDLTGGAGLRLEFPAGSDSLAWIRVGLWNQGTVPPPDCLTAARTAGLRGRRIEFFPADEPPPDSCTRMRVIITNFAGEPVRYLADTPYTDLAWGWDGKDDAGDSVPSGIYPIHSSCLDSRGQYSYHGQFYVWADEDLGECAWPLWLDRLEPAPAARVLEIARFPLFGETQGGVPLKQVAFLNPFLVRVDAPGMARFEAEVNLRADEFSRVRVTLTPAAGSAPAGAGPREGTEER